MQRDYSLLFFLEMESWKQSNDAARPIVNGTQTVLRQ